MSNNYAKIVIKGSPISKSNFKLFNLQGRAILPYNSGKYHDRYALYEKQIALEGRAQNPNIEITESVIAVLKVYYKYKKRHPDTNNITKSIFDGVEKSGVIINDAQVRRLIIEEYYDKENPRFELELFGESTYHMEYSIKKRDIIESPIEYSSPPNKKNINKIANNSSIKNTSKNHGSNCEICGKSISKENSISANNGKMLICKDCFKNLF